MRIEYHNRAVSTIKRQLTEGENKKDGQLQLPVVRHDLKIEFNYVHNTDEMKQTTVNLFESLVELA